MAKSTAVIAERPRQIVDRTSGRRPGPITRLMSPSDLGQVLKPFVFLDLFDDEGTSFSGFGWHPHSGITTLTYLWEGSVRYEDTTGAAGFLPAGGVEWFKAAGGAWHGGGAGNSGRSADSSSGSPCLPSRNSGRSKVSTKSPKTFTRADLPRSCSAPLARYRARSRRPPRSTI